MYPFPKIKLLFFPLFFLLATNNLYTDEIVIDRQKTNTKETREIIYGETTMKVKEAKSRGASIQNRKDNDTVTVKYPKVEIKEKSVTFYNDKGEKRKEVISSHFSIDTQVSSDKKAIGIRQYDAPDKLEIYDQNGNKTRSSDIPRLQQYLVANDSSFLVFGHKLNSIGGPGPIYFYNKQGKMIKSVPDMLDNTTMIPIRALYAPNNCFVVFQIQSVEAKSSDINDYSIFLQCFNKDGNELWKLEIKDLDATGLRDTYFTAPYRQLEITNDSKSIILRGISRTKEGKKTWIVSSEGKIIKENKGGW